MKTWPWQKRICWPLSWTASPWTSRHCVVDSKTACEWGNLLLNPAVSFSVLSQRPPCEEEHLNKWWLTCRFNLSYLLKQELCIKSHNPRQQLHAHGTANRTHFIQNATWALLNTVVASMINSVTFPTSSPREWVTCKGQMLVGYEPKVTISGV